MDLPTARRLAANCLCIGFDGHQLPDGARDLLAAGVRSVILFSRNVRTREQLIRLVTDINAAAGEPVVVSVDQEGGRVQRLGPSTGVTQLPPMRTIGAAASAAAAAAAAVAGARLARDLRELGISLDFAPVVDVDTNPANPVIGDRSFSDDPAIVARCGAAFITAMQAGGVAACAKHFPGHGDTSQDSHVDLPRLPHSMDRLRAVELQPFQAAIKAGVACIMTAHVMFEAIDPSVPATMSSRVLSDLLRGELGYDGVIITDCLEMQAIADRYDVGDAALQSMQAGADLALCCHTLDRQRRIIERVASEAARNDEFASQLAASADRVAGLRRFASSAAVTHCGRGCSVA